MYLNHWPLSILLFTSCSTPQDAAIQNLIHQKKEATENEKQVAIASQQSSFSILGHCSAYFPNDPTPNSLTCQQVIVKLINDREMEISTARPDTYGKFKFSDVPTGKYHLIISKNWSIQVTPQDSILPGDKIDLRVFPSQSER